MVQRVGSTGTLGSEHGVSASLPIHPTQPVDITEQAVTVFPVPIFGFRVDGSQRRFLHPGFEFPKKLCKLCPEIRRHDMPH